MSRTAMVVVLITAAMLAAGIAGSFVPQAEAGSDRWKYPSGRFRVISGDDHYLLYDGRNGDTWIYFPKKGQTWPEWTKVKR